MIKESSKKFPENSPKFTVTVDLREFSENFWWFLFNSATSNTVFHRHSEI